MAINLADEVQKNLGLPKLQKIDPNTQEIKKPEDQSSIDYLGQAAIPTVLLGLYKFSRTKEGNTEILSGSSDKLLTTIFGKDRDAVIEKVSIYTENSTEYTIEKMREIAREAIRILREQLKGNTSDTAVQTFLTDQRSNILKTLPAGLQIGSIFHDDTIDDRTNKMEGPFSNHMHWIEKLFSSVDRKKEENW